jgi:hypothetical protein
MMCSTTGLAVPECSCAACVVEMIKRVEPRLLEPSGADVRELRVQDAAAAHGSTEEIDLAA